MIPEILSTRKSLNKAYLKVNPVRSDMERFNRIFRNCMAILIPLNQKNIIKYNCRISHKYSYTPFCNKLSTLRIDDNENKKTILVILIFYYIMILGILL